MGEIGCFLSHYFIWEDVSKKISTSLCNELLVVAFSSLIHVCTCMFIKQQDSQVLSINRASPPSLYPSPPPYVSTVDVLGGGVGCDTYFSVIYSVFCLLMKLKTPVILHALS